MAISPPNFQKDAVPTPNGWVHPKTRELRVSKRISKDAIDAFYGQGAFAPARRARKEDRPTTLTEAPTSEEDVILEYEMESDVVDLEDMTKRELEALGREHGVELDRRENKESLISQVRTLID